MSRKTRPIARIAMVTVLLGAIPASLRAQTPGSNETETVGSNRTRTVGGNQSEAESSKPKEIVVVGSKVKDVVRSQGVSLSLEGTVPVDVDDPGRTGLAPGRYALVLPDRPVRLGEHIRIRLKSFDHHPGSAPAEIGLSARLEGCNPSALAQDVSAIDVTITLSRWGHATTRPRPDGGLELRVPARDVPACALVGLLLPAIQKVR